MKPPSELIAFPDHPLPFDPSEKGSPLAVIHEKRLPNGMVHKIIVLDDPEAVRDYINKPREHSVAEDFAPVRGLLYLVVSGVLIVSLAFIGAGLALVYLGATGNSELILFGLNIKSANVGIISIALGALVMILLIRNVMGHVRLLLGR